VPVVPDVSEDILAGASQGEKFEALIVGDPHSSMYDAEGLPPFRPEALLTGLAARGTKSVAEYQPTKIVVLAESADAGGWISIDAVHPYDEHVFLAATEVASTVERALRAAADPGWRQLPMPATERLLGSDFVVFDRVIFSDHDRLNGALSSFPVAVSANLRLSTTARPRLVNGLPLNRSVTRSLYLAGGEPDLILPVGAEPRDVDVALDGVGARLRASIFPFPFSRLGPYAPGSHCVVADCEELTFVVSTGSADDRTPHGIGSLAWLGDQLKPSPGNSGICGAVTAERQAERPILVKRGAQESWLIQPSGTMARVTEPAAPSFVSGVNFTIYDMEQDQAAWLAQKRSRGWSVTCMRPQAPTFRGLSDRERALWDQLVTSVRSTDQLWTRYCQEWAQYRGC
jgi:hypothetical protein